MGWRKIGREMELDYGRKNNEVIRLPSGETAWVQVERLFPPRSADAETNHKRTRDMECMWLATVRAGENAEEVLRVPQSWAYSNGFAVDTIVKGLNRLLTTHYGNAGTVNDVDRDRLRNDFLAEFAQSMPTGTVMTPLP